MKVFPVVLASLAFATSMVKAAAIGSTPMLTSRASNSTRYVFAHFIVGIVSNRNSASDWDADMIRAKAYNIDAFALNIGTDFFTDTQLQYAYDSASNNGMKVFLSIDFNWWSTGAGYDVGRKIAQYAKHPAQLYVDSKVYVSTFVGDGVDVAAMRNAVGSPIYFAPNFHPASGQSLAAVDSAFNWMGWPNNGYNRAPSPGQTGTVEAGDQVYLNALGGKDYLAPVSPWFFTHYGSEVSYSKNWLFPGDSLWYDRWQGLLATGPRFIEIVSWNDYGESHYVGPLSSTHTDDGASKWCNDMPHNAWLDMARPFIAAYKAGATSVNNYIDSDQLVYWYRPQPKSQNCDNTDTCMTPLGNPDYYVGRPNGWETVTDNVFVVSLLKSPGIVTINSGNNSQTFRAPAGAKIFTVPMGIGKQTFSLTRNGQDVLSGMSMKDIIAGCVCGLYNFNAYVGSLPESISDSLSGDGYSQFANGLRVSTCSAKPSLSAQTTTSTTSATSSSTTSSSVTTTTSTTTTSSTTTSTPTTTSSTTTSAPTTTSSTTTSTPTTTSSSTTTKPTTSSSTSTSSTTTSTSVTTASTSTTTSPTTSSTTATSSSTTTSTLTTTSSTTSSRTPSTTTTSSATTTPTTTSSATTTPTTTSSTTTTSPTTTSSTGTSSTTTPSTSSSTTTSTPTTTSSSTTTSPTTITSSTTTTISIRATRPAIPTPSTSSTTSSPTTSSSTKPSTTTSSSSSSSSSTTTTSSTTTSATPAATGCTSGVGYNNYTGLCRFACQYGYCPSGPCTCMATGPLKPAPPSTGVKGYPAYGLDDSYLGLCSFSCDKGYCPSSACRTG